MLNRGMRLVVVVAALAATVSAHASSRIGWVHADGYAQQRAHPARFYPGNLLDGDRHTATCFAAGATGHATHAIHIGFKGSPRITALRIDNGDQRRKQAPKGHHRVRELVLRSANATQTLSLPDTDARQVVKLGAAIVGDHLTVVVRSAYGHGGLVCLSGLTFMARRRPLVARGLRYDRHRAPLEGVWAAGPKGAPERFLVLFYDGLYRWTYLPNDPDARHQTFMGRWTVHGHALRLQVPGRSVTLRFHLKRHAGQAGADADAPDAAATAPDATAPDAAAHRQLDLTGSRRLPRHLAGAYRDHWL